MGIEQWSTTPGSNTNANTGINWDEGMAPSAVNDSARSVMADIRAWYEDAEWLKLGENGSANAFSISYVSATVFKFPSTDRRTLIPINRRIKAGVGAGIIYGTVTDSSLSASDTQITVSWDSGSLDTSLSYVSVGILNSTNNSLPRNLDLSLSDVTISGALTLSAITGNPDASLSDVSAATIAGSVVATQADQEAASAVDKVVSPGRQQFHPSAAKGWIKCNVAGSVTVSYNVTSITDVGTGQVLVTWATDFSSANYAALVTVEDTANNSTFISNSTPPAAGATQFVNLNASGALVDPSNWYAVAFGDQ